MTTLNSLRILYSDTQHIYVIAYVTLTLNFLLYHLQK